MTKVKCWTFLTVKLAAWKAVQNRLINPLIASNRQFIFFLFISRTLLQIKQWRSKLNFSRSCPTDAMDWLREMELRYFNENWPQIYCLLLSSLSSSLSISLFLFSPCNRLEESFFFFLVFCCFFISIKKKRYVSSRCLAVCLAHIPFDTLHRLHTQKLTVSIILV